MEKEFIGILKKIAEKHGKEQFLDFKKCKAIVSDYAGSEYRNEKGLLLRAVEAGVSNVIFCAEKNGLDSCMKAMQRKLHEEQFMDASIAQLVVSVLANILRDVEIKEVKTDIKKGIDKYDEAISFYMEEQYDKAFPIFEALANENHAGAMSCLGLIYFNGHGTEKNDKLAYKWFLKSAEKGYVYAQMFIGNFYLEGIGVEKNNKLSFEWYLKAAKQGAALAQTEVSICYQNGDGVNADPKLAFEWSLKAAEQGFAQGQFHVGLAYVYGEVVEKNEKLAFEWTKKAADQGFLEAYHNLGIFYYNGIGVSIDQKKGIEYFKKAADQGYEQSQLIIIQLTAEGKI